jgi:phytoene synthase
MNIDTAIVDPERRLALTYAAPAGRPALTALWMLDERLGALIAAARDPLLGQIRLTWWREALIALDAAPPPPEPLLAMLQRALPGQGAALARLTEGWLPLLDPLPFDEAALLRHGDARGGALFALAGAALGGGPEGLLEAAGKGWALADLSRRLSDRDTALRARRLAGEALAGIAGLRWARPVRPLGALAMLARRDASASGPHERQGAPARIARMIGHRITGR